MVGFPLPAACHVLCVLSAFVVPLMTMRRYSVLRGDFVDRGAWIPIADVPATSTNRIVEVRDPTVLAPEQTQRFYRLITPRLPP